MTLRDKHQAKLFSIEMKMADIPDMDHRLLGVMRRFGIHFGFGERTVGEVCTEAGINPFTLVLICRIYASDSYVPSNEELSRSSICDLVKYLHNSHDFYIGIVLENLSSLLMDALSCCDSARRTVIEKFYLEYKKEILKHFAYEEEVAFPYIEALIEGRQTNDGYTISQFEANHTHIDEKLNDLKNIVMKYMPAGCDDNKIQDVLSLLYSLEDDLGRHTYIEDDILVPMVVEKEESMCHDARS